MEVKKGYKQTEVGVIPEDWDVKTLGSIFDFSGGFSASRDQLTSDGYCYLHYGDIHGSKKTFIDVRVEYQDIPKLDVPLNKVNRRSLLTDGDIVFVDASEDDEGTSRHVVVNNDKEIPYISGLHTIVAKSKSGLLNKKYKRYCFQSRDIKNQFIFYSVGTKVSGINKSNISKLVLPVPPPQEQSSIADALSDVDDLIDGLDKLIAKKCDIKQATMQELLICRKRLPGFSEKWEMKKLGTIGTFRGGNGFPEKYQGAVEGDYPFFKVSDMNNVGNSIFMINANNYISKHVRSTLGANIFPKNTIVFAKVGAAIFLERKKILSCESCIDNNVMGFIFNEKTTNYRFLHYLLLSIQLGRYVSTTALPSLNGNELSDLEFNFPEIKEQSAIANVLSDIDFEIELLEAKLDKTHDLKKGMMQELLTGRIRLV